MLTASNVLAGDVTIGPKSSFGGVHHKLYNSDS
jgi:hypothetical protein